MNLYKPIEDKLDQLRNSKKEKIVLLTTGALNPIHIGHLKMLKIAQDNLEKKGFEILCTFISPSSDSYLEYKKYYSPNFFYFPFEIRCKMVKAAIEEFNKNIKINNNNFNNNNNNFNNNNNNFNNNNNNFNNNNNNFNDNNNNNNDYNNFNNNNFNNNINNNININNINNNKNINSNINNNNKYNFFIHDWEGKKKGDWIDFPYVKKHIDEELKKNFPKENIYSFYVCGSDLFRYAIQMGKNVVGIKRKNDNNRLNKEYEKNNIFLFENNEENFDTNSTDIRNLLMFIDDYNKKKEENFNILNDDKNEYENIMNNINNKIYSSVLKIAIENINKMK